MSNGLTQKVGMINGLNGNNPQQKQPSKEDYLLHYDRGITLYKIGKIADALIELEKAVELNPNFADAYYRIGIIYHRHPESTLITKEIEKTEQQLDELDLELGLTELETICSNPNTKAIEMLNKAISINPKHEAAYLEKADTLFDLKDYDEAAKNYVEILKLNPKNAEACFNLGCLYRETGNANNDVSRLNHALECFNRVLRIIPNREEALQNRLCTICEIEESKNKEKFDETRTAALELLKVYPNNVAAKTILQRMDNYGV